MEEEGCEGNDEMSILGMQEARGNVGVLVSIEQAIGPAKRVERCIG